MYEKNNSLENPLKFISIKSDNIRGGNFTLVSQIT